MLEKTNQKYYKVILACVSVISILIYIFFIIYSNKAHQIFILKDPTYNDALYNYDNLSRIFISLYIISIHVIAFFVFCLNMKSKVKGMLYLIMMAAAIFAFCFVLEMVLDYYFFNPYCDILQFLLILTSISILYLILCVFNTIKNKRLFSIQ